MFVRNVALVSEEIDMAELTKVASALQVQAVRDFSPLWGVNATVAAFGRIADVSIGRWPIWVKQTINDPGDLGYHTDRRHQPYAIVLYRDGWTITASHEMLEMLADPFGNRLVAGPSIRPGDKEGRVEYLVEVCDPCEDSRFAYSVNGVIVSDFITPHYHDPEETTGARYSFTGAIKAPRQVLPGGYISFNDPIDGRIWMAMNAGGTKLQFQDLGPASAMLSLREQTHAYARALNLPVEDPANSFHPKDANVKSMKARRAGADKASDYAAQRFLALTGYAKPQKRRR
jgi:hypothetical protein